MRSYALRTSLTAAAPWVLILLLAVSTGLLASKHRKLEEDFQLHRRADLRVRAGSFLPPFDAVTTTGSPLRAGEAANGGYQVIILLTADCRYCARMLPIWASLHAEISRQDSVPVSFAALTTDSMNVAREYARSHSLAIPLAPFQGDRYASLFHAHLVPQTLVVNADGQVVFARGGVFQSKETMDSLRSVLRPTPERVSTTVGTRQLE